MEEMEVQFEIIWNIMTEMGNRKYTGGIINEV